MGWETFSLLGHSLGAIVSVIIAGALPERINRLALIDGLIPPLGEPEGAAERMGAAPAGATHAVEQTQTGLRGHGPRGGGADERCGRGKPRGR